MATILEFSDGTIINVEGKFAPVLTSNIEGFTLKPNREFTATFKVELTPEGERLMRELHIKYLEDKSIEINTLLGKSTE